MSKRRPKPPTPKKQKQKAEKTKLKMKLLPLLLGICTLVGGAVVFLPGVVPGTLIICLLTLI